MSDRYGDFKSDNRSRDRRSLSVVSAGRKRTSPLLCRRVAPVTAVGAREKWDRIVEAVNLPYTHQRKQVC